ncbi:hypothetical protein J4E81_008852 [Alternaria sp. BMP 2799]|nr:hypothetical protein J4E81_008852 [Alternaria sp. BMP 2799]
MKRQRISANKKTDISINTQIHYIMDDYTRKKRFNEADDAQQKLKRTLETLESDIDKHIVPRPSSPERIKNSIKDATWGKKQAETRKRERDEENGELKKRIRDASGERWKLHYVVVDHGVPGTVEPADRERAKKALDGHGEVIRRLEEKMGMPPNV